MEELGSPNHFHDASIDAMEFHCPLMSFLDVALNVFS